jgi:hypothetical protein
LSIFRTPSPFSSARFHLAVTTPAVVVVAAVAGSLGAWPAGAAAPAAATRPAAIIRPADGSGHAARAGLASGAARPAQLDAVLAVSISSKDSTAAASSAASATAKRKLTPRQIARRLLGRFHWGERQFPALNDLWSRESSWNKHAENLYTGAYGIPQAEPGDKMSTAGAHWQTSARTQILWGLKYIKARYGSPRGAWDHELATGWY